MSEVVAARAQQAELELIAKGYTERQAQAAVSQARAWAVSIGAKVKPDIRERVVLDLMENRLRGVERDYLAGMLSHGARPAVS